MRVLVVIGTRPEAIKMAPVVRELQQRLDEPPIVCATGQHREMLAQMLDLFGIVPDHDLNVMQPRQTPVQVTSAVAQGIDRVLEVEQPDWVLVQGDTTTVMAASLAVYWRRIAVGHVEAGLRTFDKYAPFPEEINRRVTGVVADLHFAPTPWAAQNLLREGVPDRRIEVTGNTVIDALKQAETIPFDRDRSSLAAIPDDGRKLVLVTAHRSENFGAGMESISKAIRTLARRHPDAHFVYPVHLNPAASEPAYRNLAGLGNVSLLGPLGYLEVVWLLRKVHMVVTDSGGLQEEAAGTGKPVLVLRESTERPEAVQAGTARLVGANYDEIVTHGDRILRDPLHHLAIAEAANPYGDGTAARRIVDRLLQHPQGWTERDNVYEIPSPQHPLDALLHHATEDLPEPYRRHVMQRFKSRRDALGLPN